MSFLTDVRFWILFFGLFLVGMGIQWVLFKLSEGKETSAKENENNDKPAEN